MAKYTKRARLGAQERQQLLAEFAEALVALHSTEDAAAFIQDLLTRQEAEMLAKRLAIADRLIDGRRYEDIYRELRVSAPTIARVQAWLQSSGKGFQLVRRRKPALDMRPARKRRAKVTLYNWPTRLVEDLIDAADERQRRKLEAWFSKLDEKSDLYHDLAPLFGQLLANPSHSQSSSRQKR